MLMGGCWHGCSKDMCCKFQYVLEVWKKYDWMDVRVLTRECLACVTLKAFWSVGGMTMAEALPSLNYSLVCICYWWKSQKTSNMVAKKCWVKFIILSYGQPRQACKVLLALNPVTPNDFYRHCAVSPLNSRTTSKDVTNSVSEFGEFCSLLFN